MQSRLNDQFRRDITIIANINKTGFAGIFTTSDKKRESKHSKQDNIVYMQSLVTGQHTLKSQSGTEQTNQVLNTI